MMILCACLARAGALTGREPGLIWYVPCDSTGGVEIVSATTATASQGTASANAVAGAGSFLFGAANDRQTYGSVSLVNLSRSMTCSAWVFLTNTSVYAAVGGILMHNNGAVIYGGIDAASDNTMYSNWTLEGGGQFGDSFGAIPLNTWVHLLFSVDGNGSSGMYSSVLYINGRIVKSSRYGSSANRLTQAVAWTVGNDAKAVSTRFFRGYIDECSIWNRALSPQEVANLYRFGTPGDPASVNRVGQSNLMAMPPSRIRR